MKNILLVIILFSIGTISAQNKVVDAFSKSYQYEAKKEYKKALDAMLSINDNKNYEINFRLGWLYYVNGDFVKSKMYYTNAIKLQPKTIEARLGLVYPLSAMKNIDEVIKVYKDILKIDPNNSTVNYRLAYIYFLRKDWNSTEKYAKNVVRLYPFDYYSNLLLGSTLIKKGQMTEAKKYLLRALEYNPQSADAKALLKNI